MQPKVDSLKTLKKIGQILARLTMTKQIEDSNY